MQLLPQELRMQLPSLYEQENIKDPIVHVKFFTPDSSWTWYVTEGEEEEAEPVNESETVERGVY